MESDNKSIKIIAGVCTVLLLGTLFYLGKEMRANSNLEDGLKSELLKSESLLSEKLALEKTINELNSEITQIKGKNHEIDKLLSAAHNKLDIKDQDIQKLQKKNSSLAGYKTKYDELGALKKELEKQLSIYAANLQKLSAENLQLTQSIASLEQKNRDLSLELTSTRLASINDVCIESVKGKHEKLTVNARKTKQLKVNVNVPSQSEHVTFKITDPSGKELTPKDGVITAKEVSSPTKLTASRNTTPVFFKQMEMVYVPKNKLIPGTYFITIMEGSNQVSRLQVKLR